MPLRILDDGHGGDWPIGAAGRWRFLCRLQEPDNALFGRLLSQALVVFLSIRSVGGTGDGRRYNLVVGLRAVETIDFMTACRAELPHHFLDHLSRRIVNEIDGISRVVHDIPGKPPGTIEWK